MSPTKRELANISKRAERAEKLHQRRQRGAPTPGGDPVFQAALAQASDAELAAVTALTGAPRDAAHREQAWRRLEREAPKLYTLLTEEVARDQAEAEEPAP